jgi:hypothetical protein
MPRRQRIGANSDVGAGVGIRRAKSLPALARIKSDRAMVYKPKAKSLPVATQAKKGVCSRILTPKQVGPICWFLTAFVAMFYSQRSRKILLEASKSWDKDKNNKLIQSLKHILNDKYLKTNSREDEGENENFSDDTFKLILTYLNEHDPLTFPYNPNRHSGGFFTEYYIGKLYRFLNVDYKIFDYYKKENYLFYSYLNDELNDVVDYETIENKLKISLDDNIFFEYNDEDMEAPKILMVIVRDYKYSGLYHKLYPYTIISEGDTKKNTTSMNEMIFYRGSEYHLDSVILENFNDRNILGHSIAGITCKKDKYIYNGWTRINMNPLMANQENTRDIPCELMPYNWNIKKHGDFCLRGTKRCIPDVLKIKKGDMCFNFSKGTRILVYVRKDAISATSRNTMSYGIIPTPIKKTENIFKLATSSKSSSKSKSSNKNLFPSLQAFLVSLSNEVEEGTTLIPKIVGSFTTNDKKKIINAIHRYFEDYNIDNQSKYFNKAFPDNFENIIKHFIRNIYSQLLNPSKKAFNIECLSYTNRIYFEQTKLLSNIKEHLLSFMYEYKPKIENVLIRYIFDIIDDVIGEQYVAKISFDDRDTATDITLYRNEYYLLSNDIHIEGIRLPKGMGLMTDIKIGGQLVVDENPQNNFTYEECKMWVKMPIFNPRTFERIEIDSPIYNRLLCISYQYDTHLIPRMITSRGFDVIYIVISRIKEILSNKKKPSQTREQLENYIRKLQKQPNKGLLSRITKGIKAMLKIKK